MKQKHYIWTDNHLGYELDVSRDEFEHLYHALSIYIIRNEKFIDDNRDKWTHNELSAQVDLNWELMTLQNKIERQADEQNAEVYDDE